MRHAVVGIALISLISLISPIGVQADFDSAYRDQVYNYQLYRDANSQFQIARSSYLTYRTLTAQNEAIDKFRKVLRARNQVMITYYNTLQEKMNTTDGVGEDQKKTFNDIKESEKSWLEDNKKTIDAAASIEDLNSVSGEFQERYKQMDTETKQAIGAVEMAKLTESKKKTESLMDELSHKLSDINSAGGEDTSRANRGIISAKNKLNIYNEKFNSANEAFFPPERSREVVNLYDGQRRLSEANQYLRETVDFLLEIVKSFTG